MLGYKTATGRSSDEPVMELAVRTHHSQPPGVDPYHARLGHVEKILVFQASRTLNFGSLLMSFADVAQSAIDVAVPTCAHQVVHHVCGQHGVRQRTCLDIKLHAGTAVDQIGSASPADLQTTIIVSTEELSRWLMRAMTSRCAWKVQFCNQLAFSIRTPSLG